MSNEMDVEPLIASESGTEQQYLGGSSGLNIIRSSTSLSNLTNGAVVVIEGDASWSRRREIQSRIRRQAEQYGCPIEDVIVTTTQAPFSLPRNISTTMLRSVENHSEDSLSGVRVEVPYRDLMTQVARQEGAEIMRFYDRPFQDRRRRADAVQEGNRHRNNLISRLVGPPLPFPLSENGDANQNGAASWSEARRFLAYPDHLVPPQYFLLNVPVVSSQVESDGKQSSLVTILAIWNTMMGTSLLATPWAISQSGIIMGPCIALFTAGLAGYTAITIVQDRKEVEKFQPIPEFAPLVGCVLGKKAEITATIFSLLAVAGAGVVYWVLMSNFAYNGVSYIYNYATHSMMNQSYHSFSNSSHDNVICPSKMQELLESEDTSTFEKIWNPSTAPIFLLLLIFPLISVKSVGFFTKLNSIGTISVFFMMGLVSYYAASWGVNVDLFDPSSKLFVPLFKWTFPCLTGTLSLGFFIHNCVITITDNNKNQENNARDVRIAFSLVTFTYLMIGTLFYITFPIEKDCLEDVF
uniref:Putative amino acid permease F13H10.3like [Strongylocentrotus purpuratus] n=1 Tax=Lepeophtheirus salmonis TaxID=72036 RepID=A0A0K2TPS9_LEPSM